MTRSVDDVDNELRERLHRAGAEMMESPPPRPRSLATPADPARRPLVTALVIAVTAGALALAIGYGRVHRSEGPSPASEGNKTAAQIYSDALAALQHASSYHAVIDSTATSQGAVHAVISYDSSGDFELDITANGAMKTYIVVGTSLYIHDREALPSPLAAIAGDHFVRLDAAGTGTLLRAYVSPQHLGTCLLGDHGQLSKGATTDVNGVPAIVVRSDASPAGQAAFSVEVALSGVPYPLRIEQLAASTTSTAHPDCTSPTSSGSGAINLSGSTLVIFSSMDGSVRVDAPLEYIDPSRTSPQGQPTP